MCKHTNAYAWTNIFNKSTYADKDRAWVDTNPQEMRKLIGLLLYMGLIHVGEHQLYWSTKSLYHCLGRDCLCRETVSKHYLKKSSTPTKHGLGYSVVYESSRAIVKSRLSLLFRQFLHISQTCQRFISNWHSIDWNSSRKSSWISSRNWKMVKFGPEIKSLVICVGWRWITC